VAYNPYPRLPIGPLRDLLGITRALYRASRAEEPPDATRLEALDSIGRALGAALREARGHPGTVPYQEAWAATERAVTALQGLVDNSMRVGLVIRVTAGCIARARQTVGGSGDVIFAWRGDASLVRKPPP
jgi:hypothetical protein